MLFLELLRCSFRRTAEWWSCWTHRIRGSHGCSFIARIFWIMKAPDQFCDVNLGLPWHLFNPVICLSPFCNLAWWTAELHSGEVPWKRLDIIIKTQAGGGRARLTLSLTHTLSHLHVHVCMHTHVHMHHMHILSHTCTLGNRSLPSPRKQLTPVGALYPTWTRDNMSIVNVCCYLSHVHQLTASQPCSSWACWCLLSNPFSAPAKLSLCNVSFLSASSPPPPHKIIPLQHCLPIKNKTRELVSSFVLMLILFSPALSWDWISSTLSMGPTSALHVLGVPVTQTTTEEHRVTMML